MKKVLVYGLKNMYGGLERYLLSMQEQLRDQVAFCYLVEQCDCIHQSFVEANNGRICYVPSRHPLAAHLKAVDKTLQELRRETDTLYVNVNGISFDIAVILMGLRHHYRVIVHSHNAMMEPIKNPYYRALHKTLEAVALTILKTLKIERLAVSEKASRYLFGNRESRLVTPGMRIAQYRYSQADRSETRQALSLNEESLFGFVGRLTAVKNPMFVIRIFEEIRKLPGYIDARLVMVGDGPLRQELEQHVASAGLADAVTFVGEVENTARYYHAMDYLLLPSESEGLSLVAIEAQASGLPIACSQGRFPDVIRLTELVNMVPLEDGAAHWAQSCVEHGTRFRQEDRGTWNEEVSNSPFELEKAAQTLCHVLRAGE